MPRKRKTKKKASERKQEDIQRRIEKSEKKRSAAACMPEAQSPATEPDRAPENKQKRPGRRRLESREPKRAPIRTLVMKDKGDRTDVTFPSRMTAGTLLKAIRDGAYMAAGTVYIAAGHSLDSKDDADMAYAFHGGLFIRQDMPDKKDRSARFLSDVIDTPVRSIYVTGGTSDMSWFVTLWADT